MDSAILKRGVLWQRALDAASISDFVTGGNRVEDLVERYADEQLEALILGKWDEGDQFGQLAPKSTPDKGSTAG